MWSPDKEVHEQCVARIVAVASEVDTLKRYRLALSEIAAGLATLPVDADRTEWASVMAMYALQPEMFDHQRSEWAEMCDYDPRELAGRPIGMFHCPKCGDMILAGLPHPPSDEFREFDCPTAEEADAYLRGQGVIKKCEVCGQDATLTNNFVTYLMEQYSAFHANAEKLRAALDEILKSGVEFDDNRMGYVVMQINRAAIADARAVLAETEVK